MCTFQGCSTKSHNNSGFCVRHGGKGVCATAECNQGVIARGLCAKHGAFGACIFEGCAASAAGKRKLCEKHGGLGTCKIEDCTGHVRARGLCYKHDKK